MSAVAVAILIAVRRWTGSLRRSRYWLRSGCSTSSPTLFAVASTKGILPVVAVGGSMYPAFTIALAHLVLGERLATIQWGGVVLALVGVGLIAGGS